MFPIFLTSIFIFLLGLCVGSFLNVVILRLANEETLGGRSYCPHCRHQLTWKDLIPLISFLWLQGKCRYCHKKISIQYPLVEITTGLVFLLILNFLDPQGIPAGAFEILNQFEIFQFLNILNLVFLLYIACSLIIIFVYDLKHYLIPDKILLPAIAITFLYRLADTFHTSAPFINYVLAAALASGFFLAIFLVSKGAWMGFGDVKLAILLGLLTGFPNIILALFLSFLFGSIIGVGLLVSDKKGLKSEVPFAPFLIAGTFIALFWGQNIVNMYMQFFIF